MKTIGLLGGMSWESTRIYYRELNQQINQNLGGLHSAQMVLFNVDFAPIEALMQAGEWDEIGRQLADHCKSIQSAGADFLVIATNTMHKLAPQIEAALDIPLLHIADVVGKELKNQEIKQVGLLGTAFTMEEDFYKDRLAQGYGIQTWVPNAAARHEVDRVVFEELCHGIINEQSKQIYLDTINQLTTAGAQAIILGCTEIGLLIKQSDTHVPLIDATHSHIKAAVKTALE